MTVLAEQPVDLVGLAAEVEAFITHPAPYALGEGRAQLRADARTAAFATLLGSLIALIESGHLPPGPVADAIRAALDAGIGMQEHYLVRRRTDA